MSNKAIINKLKEQAKDLKDKVYTDDDKLKDWVDETKIYIRGLWLDKKDDNFRKETWIRKDGHSRHYIPMPVEPQQ